MNHRHPAKKALQSMNETSNGKHPTVIRTSISSRSRAKRNKYMFYVVYLVLASSFCFMVLILRSLQPESSHYSDHLNTLDSPFIPATSRNHKSNYNTKDHQNLIHPRIIALRSHQTYDRLLALKSIKHIQPPSTSGTSRTMILPPMNISDTQQYQQPIRIKHLDGQPSAETKPDQCIPQEEWQTHSFLSCNQLHELDMTHAATAPSKGNELIFLGQGWFRAAWKFIVWNPDSAKVDSLVLKTLRIEREFLDEYYELHRRDAVAMERLTWSPYVLDVYGYCGQSALNEIADFKPEIANLEKMDRALRNIKANTNLEKDKLMYIKLQLASAVATGLSHIHSVDPSGKSSNAKMAHYDINPRNIAVTKGGKPKLNDFNIAEFIHINPKTNSTCGFPSRLHEPWWRAPEEMHMPQSGEPNRLVTEKVDVYALGAVLFHILTTHSPRGKMKKELMDQVREEVARGKAPILPAPYNTSKSTGVKAFRRAMDLCFIVDPKERGTSHQVASILQKAFRKYEEKLS